MKTKNSNTKRSTVSASETSPAKEQINELARLMWEQDGRPEGRDLEFWLRAETQLKQGHKRPPS